MEIEKQARSAVNIYVVRDNKLLLGKRKKRGDGFWGLPGGHLEFGESPIMAAERELFEETGIKDCNLVYKNTVSTAASDVHYISVNFILKNFTGEPVLMEPDKFYEWKWFALDNLPDNIFIGHQKIIDNLSNNECLIN